MAKPRLHLDADASRKDLHNALVAKGHDVTRTVRYDGYPTGNKVFTASNYPPDWPSDALGQYRPGQSVHNDAPYLVNCDRAMLAR
jgi:hypothetical protein